MTKQETTEYWKNHINQAKQFDGSIPKYCKSAGIRDYTFYYWRHKLQKRVSASIKSKSSFILARIEPNSIEVAKRVDVLPDPQWVASIILHLHERLR